MTSWPSVAVNVPVMTGASGVSVSEENPSLLCFADAVKFKD